MNDIEKLQLIQSNRIITITAVSSLIGNAINAGKPIGKYVIFLEELLEDLAKDNRGIEATPTPQPKERDEKLLLRVCCIRDLLLKFGEVSRAGILSDIQLTDEEFGEAFNYKPHWFICSNRHGTGLSYMLSQDGRNLT